MRTDYTSDDSEMYQVYNERLEHLHTKASTGQDQFTPKISQRGNPNKRLNYASYFEEDDQMPEVGSQVTYTETGEQVWVVHVDSKTMLATIELPDETKQYNVPASMLA